MSNTSVKPDIIAVLNLGLKTIRTVMIETNAPKRPLPMYTLTDSQYTGGSTA